MTRTKHITERYTREKIREWFKTWLIKVPDDEPYRFFMINDTIYEFCYYFRISFMIYGIYKDTTTNSVIWFMYENDSFTDKEFLDAPRFEVPSDLTTHVINTFYEKWNR